MVSGVYFRSGNSHLSVLYVYQRKGTPQEAEEKGCQCGDRYFVSQSFMSGCGAAVEPEKRMYPMALGVDASEEGICLTYGMPDLSESTGQGKEEEDGGSRVLQISGADFTRIEKCMISHRKNFLIWGICRFWSWGEHWWRTEDGEWCWII